MMESPDENLIANESKYDCTLKTILQNKQRIAIYIYTRVERNIMMAEMDNKTKY